LTATNINNQVLIGADAYDQTAIDTRLSTHRHLFDGDDLGVQEQFRSYGPPTQKWLARGRAALTV